jgi:chromate transporter
MGFSGPFDGVSAALALGAAIALFRYQLSVIQVIAGCAVLGLMVKTIMA